MLTKVLSVSVLKIGFCQLKKLFWDILVAEVNLPGEKSFCVHSIIGCIGIFCCGVCAPQREIPVYCSEA